MISFNINEELGGISMEKYVCSVCGYIYDEASGIPEAGIAPGTRSVPSAELQSRNLKSRASLHRLKLNSLHPLLKCQTT